MNKKDQKIATARILAEMLNGGTAYRREDGKKFKIGDDVELWADTLFTKLSIKGKIKEFCEFGGVLCIRTFDSNVPHAVDCLKITQIV